MKIPQKISISNIGCSLKWHNTVDYLGYYLDANFNGESMTGRVVKKITTNLNFL